MLRHLVRVLAGLLLILIALAVGAVAFRVSIAEALLKSRLVALGLSDARVNIESLNFDRTRLVTLAAGESDHVKASAVEVSYSLPRLFRGPALDAIDSIAIDGLTLRLDLTGDGPPLGNLQTLLEAEEASAGAGTAPPVSLHNAAIELITRFGDIKTELDGSITPDTVGEVQIDLKVNLQGDVGELSGHLQATGTADGALSGTLRFDDGKAYLPGLAAGNESTIHGIGGEVSFKLADWQPLDAKGDLSFAAIGVGGLRFKDAALAFDATPENASLSGDLATEDGTFEATIEVALNDYPTTPQIKLDATAMASAETALFDALALPSPSAGAADLTLNLSGDLAPLDSIVTAVTEAAGQDHEQDLLNWFLRSALDARVQADLRDLTYPDKFSRLDGKLAADALLENGELSIGLTHDGEISAAAISPDWLAGLGLPQMASALLASGERLRLLAAGEPPTRLQITESGGRHGIDLSLAAELELDEAHAQQALSFSGLARFELDSEQTIKRLSASDLSLTGSGLRLAGVTFSSLKAMGGFTGTAEKLDGSATLELRIAQYVASDFAVKDVALELPLAVDIAGAKATLSLQEGGHMNAAQIVVEGTTVAEPAAAITSGEIIMQSEVQGTGGPTASYSLELAPEPLRVSIPRQDAAPLGIRANLDRLRLTGTAGGTQPHRGQAALRGKEVTLDDPAIAFAGIEADADYGENLTQMAVTYKVAKAKRLSDSALGLTVTIDGGLRRNGDSIGFEASARPLDGSGQPIALTLPISGQFDLEAGRGEAKLPATAVAFTPKGLQPGQLIPDLAKLIDVLGNAIIEATIQFGTGSPNGSGRLALDDLEFGYGQTPVRGVDLVLALDSLDPPGSPPGQRLRVAHVESVVPIANLELTFQVLPRADPAIKIELLTFSMADGDWRVVDTVITPGAERNAAELEVTNLDLGKVLKAIDLEGLTGSGILDGKIPLALENDDLTISDAKLEAVAPGVLSYRSSALKSSLPVDADDLDLLENPVDLAILALDNFHYDSLTITVNKKADGEAQMLLQISGRNPKLLNGYPFNFNVNLSGNVNPLVAALEQGATLTDDMIRRSWKLAP